MIFSVSRLKRKKMSLCILAGICAVSLFVINNSGEKINENAGDSYVIKIKHYGIDASEMERNVTIPLEDALSVIPGVISMQSSSENSLSSVFIRFTSGGKGRYEAVTDAAQRVYETLPLSAQRPEIFSSGSSRVPVWSASVSPAKGRGNPDDLNENLLTVQELEKILKPRLESLEGAAEVLVSGAGLKEIVIALDQEKLAAAGLNPFVAAEFLSGNDSVYSGGNLAFSGKDLIITVDGRYEAKGSSGINGAHPAGRALIPLGDGKYIELSQIAVIREQERIPDTISRLNGRKTAGIAVMGRHGADLRRLSAEIKKELSGGGAYEFTVLTDLGAEENSAFRSVLNAAVLGAVMVALTCFLLNINHFKNRMRLNYAGFFCALAVPVICLVSIAVLSICGFSVNRLMFAGIAAGVGTAVDAVILCSEKLRFMRRSSPCECLNYKHASLALNELAGPLVAGAATTIAALLPLAFSGSGEMKIIASAIAAVTFTALALSLLFLPALLLWEKDAFKKNYAERFECFIRPAAACLRHTLARISNVFYRFLAANIWFCVRFPVLILSISLIITIAAVTALYVKGADTGGYSSEDSVYAQVEFDGGLLTEEADRLLASYSDSLARNKGIKNIETRAGTGSGSILVSFDPRQTNAFLVRKMAKQIAVPGGFLFFSESSNRERYWEVFIHGDEDSKCRELARELARICAGHPVIRERVLNFKDGGKKIIFKPDAQRLAVSGAGFYEAANRIRYGVYGPVAYKRMEKDGEIDVRIRTDGKNKMRDDSETFNVTRITREETYKILVSGASGKNSAAGAAPSFYADSLMQITEDTEPSRIRRIDRRRTASITVTTAAMDPRRVREELRSLFAKLDMPPGYSVEFDPYAIRQAQALSSTVVSLLLAVVFCYMIIAAINESFTVPLLVLSAIPPSLAVPALCLVLSGSAYNSPVACAFIAVSGMTVNAGVLCVDELRRTLKKRFRQAQRSGTGGGEVELSLSIYRAIRRKMPALLSTTGTTVAGALPFLFLTEGINTLIRTLSLTGAVGIACSCICSITVIPSLLTIFSRGKLFRLCGI
ncbi:MAG: efflux RND transporter permease subunit [Treponema sp.]|nr:efflux RND transporter permease subunit [Treponema sp.]